MWAEKEGDIGECGDPRRPQPLSQAQPCDPARVSRPSHVSPAAVPGMGHPVRLSSGHLGTTGTGQEWGRVTPLAGPSLGSSRGARRVASPRLLGQLPPTSWAGSPDAPTATAATQAWPRRTPPLPLLRAPVRSGAQLLRHQDTRADAQTSRRLGWLYPAPTSGGGALWGRDARGSRGHRWLPGLRRDPGIR